MMTAREALTEFFEGREKVTAAEACAGLPWINNKTVCSTLSKMVASGELEKLNSEGRGHSATYAVLTGGVKEASIFELCRQNWGGYHIHKIFGSAGRVVA